MWAVLEGKQTMLIPICSALALVAYTPEHNPVAQHGQLTVWKGRVCDARKKPASLAGVSLFWSQWKGEFYNRSAVRWLKKDWKISAIRIPVGVTPDGYLAHPERERKKIDTAIDAAIEAGIYVIVDWHDHHAERHVVAATDFFASIARKYGQHPNVVYEIYNEPLDVGWSEVVKPYAKTVIREIRKYDPDNLIVVGTPTWSQRVDYAAKDPIKDNNVAYTLHFYAATHKEPVRQIAQRAIDAGLPIFVTEWGAGRANGNGPLDYKSAASWVEFLKKNKLSHLSWSLCDKAEASAALMPDASPEGGWTVRDLTPSGHYARSLIRSWNRNPAPRSKR